MPGKPFLSSVLAPFVAAAATGCRTRPAPMPAPGRVKVFVAEMFQHLSHVATTPQ